MRTYRTPGFTLIELIVVIVILGILAAVAVPRFVNFRDDAEKAVVESFVASLSAARTMWLGKSLFCGNVYTSTSIHMAHFVGLGHAGCHPDCPIVTARCTEDNGLYTVTGHAIDTQHFRFSGIVAAPEADLFTDCPNQGNQIRFTARTGRTITITHNPQGGGISWTASPAY